MQVAKKKTCEQNDKVVSNDNDNLNFDSHPEIAKIKALMEESRLKGHPLVERFAVDPTVAKWLLKENVNNRRFSESIVIKYAKDMKSGRWIENGDGLSLADTGELNNGQHRCLAVIKAGVVFMTNITVGLTRESRATNDIGLARSLSNILTMNGVANATIVGVITKLVIGWETTGTAAKRPTRESSNPQIQERIASDPAIAKAGEFVRSVKVPKGILSKPQVGFFHYVLMKHAPQYAEEFLTSLIYDSRKDADGKDRGLDPGDPRKTANRRLLEQNKILKHSERVEIVFRAWNAWREGRDLQQIKLNGEIPELI